MNIYSQILTGWIQEEPTMRYTPTGQAVLNFVLSCPAGNEKQDDGSKKRVYSYVRVTLWGELADDAYGNYSAGNRVRVAGILKAGKPYQSKKTQEWRSSIEFTAFEIEHVSEKE